VKQGFGQEERKELHERMMTGNGHLRSWQKSLEEAEPDEGSD